MADEILVTVKKREKTGKETNKKIRRNGEIPGIIYGQELKPVIISIPSREVKRILSTEAGENVIATVKIDGDDGPSKKVMIKELQKDPVDEHYVHVDFWQISMKKKLEMDVPVEVTGVSKGVTEGGVLEQVAWEVRVKCLPTDIPDKIIVDVTNLSIGDSIHVKDLIVKEGVEIINNPENVVVTIAAPLKEEELAVKPEESIEPEVIGKKPKEGEEAEAAEGAGEAEKGKKEEKPEKAEPEKAEKADKGEKKK